MPLITPQFTLNQDQKHIIIALRVPYVKPTKSEFYMQDKNFSFYLKPYLLQLTFFEPLKDSEQPVKAVYDSSTYWLTVHIEKKQIGEEFTQLDMLGLILNKKNKKEKQQKKGQLIQVIEGQDNDEDETQQIELNHQDGYLYGFNNQYKNIFDDLEEELLEIAILDPRQIALVDRSLLALQNTQSKFDSDIYIYDLFENEQVDDILEWKYDNNDQFNIEEINQMQNLEKREYLIENKQQLLNGLVDILFSFLYELCIFQGEFTTESAQSINQLSSQFSSFFIEDSLKNVILGNIQRALTFPLIRSFEISIKVKQILQEILKNKILIIKSLLELKSIFQKSKPRQYLNLIYIDDYLIWIQNVQKEILINLSNEIEKIEIKKSELNLNLQTIEQEALQTIVND